MTERHIPLREVLKLHRQHPPSLAVETAPERETEHHCLVIRQRNIQPFRLEVSDGRREWVDLRRVHALFEEMLALGVRAKTRPYHGEEVFAPLKVVLAERDRPIRAVVTSLPVYPWRAKLGTLLPDVHSWLGYAAVGVLNSIYGQALYRGLLMRFRKRDSSPSGLDEGVLYAMPVARADHTRQEIGVVAGLVHQITLLHQAREECLPRLQSAGPALSGAGRDLDQEYRLLFDLPIRRAANRLQDRVRLLLGLTRSEEKSLLGHYRLPDARPQLQPLLFDAWDEGGPLPAPPEVTLPDLWNGELSQEQEQCRSLLRHWQERINAPLSEPEL